MNAYEHIQEIVEWQNVHDRTCPRCGTVMDRPMNTAHKDGRIFLCDGCATIEAILNAGIINKGADKTESEFWDASNWAALRPLDWLREEETLMAIDDALETLKELSGAGIDPDTPIIDIRIPKRDN